MATDAAPSWNLDHLVAPPWTQNVEELAAELETRIAVLIDAPAVAGAAFCHRSDALVEAFNLHARMDTFLRLLEADGRFPEELTELQTQVGGRLDRADHALSALRDKLIAWGKATQDQLPAFAALERQFRYKLPTGAMAERSGTPAALRHLQTRRQASLAMFNSPDFGGFAATQNQLRSGDRTVRARAWSQLGNFLRHRLDDHAEIFAAQLDLENSRAALMGADRPEDIRHARNDLSHETVVALGRQTRAAYHHICHPIYRRKADLLGQDKLSPADRIAPVVCSSSTEYSWSQARDIALAAFARIGPAFCSAAKAFLDGGRIDAEIRQGKDAGGFCLPNASDCEPYILLNFDGSARSVLELMHELGHGVHYHLSRENRVLGLDVPFPIAETAALFAERLAFDYLLENATTRDEHDALAWRRAQDVANTVFRHMALYDFETRAHAMVRNGDVSGAEFAAAFEEMQREALGPVFEFDGSLGPWFITVPHFFSWPFYTYSYAFGEAQATLLYAQFVDDRSAFESKYLDFLAAGGSMSPESLFAPFGIDLADELTWAKAYSQFAPMLARIGADPPALLVSER